MVQVSPPFGRPIGRASIRVEHDERVEAVLVVVGVEQPRLPRAMDVAEAVVDVTRDAARHLADARVVERQHDARHAHEDAWPWSVLQVRWLRLRAKCIRVGHAPTERSRSPLPVG